jgi:outer membrane protein OmpA-like peptidoglycan-associated protein
VVFFEELGINPAKMQSITWGKNKPFMPNDTEESRSKNRRIEILINSENLMEQQLDNVYEKLIVTS